jgi:hypothetical protein
MFYLLGLLMIGSASILLLGLASRRAGEHSPADDVKSPPAGGAKPSSATRELP